MTIKTVMTAFDFLENESWECDYLKELIVKNRKVGEFNDLAEEMFQDGVEKTKLNDWMRFDVDVICDLLGIDTEDDT